MKSTALLLLGTLPSILCQDYAVPDLAYDQTNPTCKNIDKLIAATTSDKARLNKYVTVTLPARITKLNDANTSIKKTCKIISSRRPPSIQKSSSEKPSAAEPKDLCADTYKSIKNLLPYLKFLIPSIKSEYIEGRLANRLTKLKSFKTQCSASDSDDDNNTPSCPKSVQPDGYTFYPTVDSGSNDITNLAGYTVQQLADYCNSNSQCVAFNSNGWVKNKVNPTSEWYKWTDDKCLGFYVKNAPAPSGDCTKDVQVNGYTFYPTVDSGSNDITNLAGYSVQQLADYCNSNSQCVAFNSNGWVKNAVNPTSQWYQWTQDKCLGFYVKNTPPVDEYVFYPTLDSNGGDITNLAGYSVDQLKRWCSANADCKGFNNNGWVKSQINPKSQWYQWTSDQSLGMYLKKSVADSLDQGSAPTTDDYVFYQGVDSGGNDITNLGGYTVAQLKAYCSSNPQCVAFNTNGWVKNALNPTSQWYQWTTNPDQGFYVKKSAAPSTPKPADYTFYQGVDSGGNDITNLGGYSVAQLKDYCNSNAQCKGFNTNGWVKYALNPTSQWYRWSSDPNQGFYVKN